ncbi:imidazole glycerol phosphate synthase subunit HisH [Shigella boydii]|nr:imidazole glycerol phosphate synthase subunit HisH [Shigella boydii]
MNVVILDTGCANLNSVKSAIARHGYEPKSAVTRTSCCWPINYFTRRRHRQAGSA